MQPRKTLNANQACEFLGCSRATLYRLYGRGEIEGYRIGPVKGLRFFEDALTEFLENRTWE